jgi:hypothetical protein
MPNEITREEFEQRLAEMKEALNVAANNLFASMMAAVDEQVKAAEDSAAALKRIADAMEPVGAMMAAYAKSVAFASSLRCMEEMEREYFPCCPVCGKDLVRDLKLETAEARVKHVYDCIGAQKKSPYPKPEQICDECRAGVHKHLEPLSFPSFKTFTRHQQVDAIDCKNPSPDGQCICPEYLKAKKELLGG